MKQRFVRVMLCSVLTLFLVAPPVAALPRKDGTQSLLDTLVQEVLETILGLVTVSARADYGPDADPIGLVEAETPGNPPEPKSAKDDSANYGPAADPTG